MILTALRILENGKLAKVHQCSALDFNITLRITETLLEHTEAVFLYLPERKPILPRQKTHKELFLDQLPVEFTTKVFKDMAQVLDISSKSAERYIKEFIEKGYLQRSAQGQYRHILKKTR
ncbi:hypothetical protein ACSTS3_21465 [Aquimarina muelleri]|uniref:hypothetical protein n=1 Tax=Aquimarina muelleri TaxID=279356 RepID=UPI003F68412F